MEFSHPLNRLKDIIEQHIGVLARARGKWLAHEALEKHTINSLISSATGKSHAERTTNAYASQEWKDFALEGARLRNIFQFHVDKLEVLNKEWLATYQDNKIDADTIRKG